MRNLFVLALALSACAPPIEQPDAQPDASSRPDAQNDAEPMDTGIVDTGVPPMDTGVVVDTGVPPRDTGVVTDTGVQPPCTLDPRNCGMCGRVCSGGTPVCAQTSMGVWGCVNNCAGFGIGCESPDRTGAICCPGTACGPGNVGCR